MFFRAGLLLHLERYHEALSELEELRQIAPKESLVYYLLSKVSEVLIQEVFIHSFVLIRSGSPTFEELPLLIYVHVMEYGSRP